jgi:outer membrane biosynthesis protein TonB
MNEGFDKNKRRALAGTVIFHLLVVLALFFLALRTPLPLPGEEGVEVNLGYSEQGMGNQQTTEQIQTSTPPPPSTAIPEEVEAEELATADDEAPALAEKIEPTPKPVEKPIEKPVEKPKEVQPQPKPEPEVVEPPKPTVNQRALFRGSSTANASSNEGITGKPGDQGRPDGLRDVTRYDGQGGQGNGPSFNLGGRGSKNLVVPKSNFTEQGNVVVDIWVDRKGIVVRAEVNLRGTTILDQKLRNVAVQAALNSVFAQDPSAAPQQKGNITYTFIIGN